MSLLIISLLALVAGPFLYRAARRAPASMEALDGFVVIAIVGLVLIHIIPHAVAGAGIGAIGIALLGLLGPGLVERSLHRAARHAHTATEALAILGLTAHAFFDGVGLSGTGETADLLGIAVVLHRLPIAVTVWWVLRRERNVLLPGGALAAMGIATVAGFVAHEGIDDHLDARWIGYLQALVAGSVLHVVLHRPELRGPVGGGGSNARRWYSGAGALAALALVAALSETHLPFHSGPGGLDVGAAFVALALESAPALLLAFAMAGMVQLFLPRATAGWMRTGRPVTESVRGMVFGLPLPICSCGVIPIYQALVQQQVPATAGMAFLVATPELGLDAVLISVPLLGAELAVTRLVAAAIVAFLAGWVIGRLAPSPAARVAVAGPPPARSRERFLTRVRAGLRFGFGEIVDHTGPWLLLGLGVASLVEPMLKGEWITALPVGADVVLFAFLGMPSYVCASGATPFVAVLIHKGVSPGAALAFLLTGPATNVTTFGILSRLHGRRIALAFGALVAGTSIGLGFVVNQVLRQKVGIALHEAAYETPSLLSQAALLALALIFLASLLRQGPRGFIGQILAPYGGHSDHDHGDHDHDHGDHGDDSHGDDSHRSDNHGGGCC